MPECPGCRKSFFRGYSNHILQTQKPACRVVLAHWQALREPLGSDSDTEVTNHLDLDFEGLHEEGSVNNDEEEDLMYGANNYGEAPIPEQLEGGMDVDGAGIGGSRGSRTLSAPLRRWRRDCRDQGLSLLEAIKWHFIFI
jgi:hypothetical protein